MRAEDITVELNISTPLLAGFPLLPVIDWVATFGADGFGVKTGARNLDGADITVDLTMDGLLVKAGIGFMTLDVLGAVTLSGSLGFELGPTTDGHAGRRNDQDLKILTIGAANVYGFIGFNGPYVARLEQQRLHRPARLRRPTRTDRSALRSPSTTASAAAPRRSGSPSTTSTSASSSASRSRRSRGRPSLGVYVAGAHRHRHVRVRRHRRPDRRRQPRRLVQRRREHERRLQRDRLRHQLPGRVDAARPGRRLRGLHGRQEQPDPARLRRLPLRS